MSRTVIRVGQEPPVLDAFADFFDGRRPVARRAALSLEAYPGGRALVISPPGRDRLLWPLSEIRRIPDQAADDILVLARAGDPLSRLLVRDEAARRAILSLCHDLDRRPPVKGTGRLVAWSVAAVASVALIVFLLVPALADRLAAFMPPEGERALGDATYRQIRSALSEDGLEPLPVCTDAAGVAALQALQERIAGQADLPHPLRLEVLDHPMVNAFALPGGRVALFRGLIEEAASPDEVAAVLAHEIGHVAGRDPTRSALRSAGSIGIIGLLLGDFAGGAAVQLLVNRLIEASFSQQAEAAADSFAHRALAEAGIRPSAMADFFDRLRAREGEPSPIVAHFLSHPQMGDRIAAARAADSLLSGPARPALSARQWKDLRGICR